MTCLTNFGEYPTTAPAAHFKGRRPWISAIAARLSLRRVFCHSEYDARHISHALFELMTGGSLPADEQVRIVHRCVKHIQPATES
jgi:hypothetical protein